jgi:membrane-associated phospholipid phosphatase
VGVLPSSLALALILAQAADAGAPDDAPVAVDPRVAAPAEAIAPSRAQKSVYEIRPWVDGPLLVTTGLAYGALALFGPSWIVPHCPCSASEVPRIDQVALGKHNQAVDSLSTATTLLAVAAPVVVDALDVGFSRPLAEDMVVYAEVLTISGTATELAKYVVQRPRPYVYGSTSQSVIDASSSYVSFFSGHTTTTFAALTSLTMTVSLRHGPQAWLWVVTALVGTSVAIERVAAGQHFPTDVMMGAVVGVGTGLLIPWLHERGAAAMPAVSLAQVQGGGVLVVRGGW